MKKIITLIATVLIVAVKVSAQKEPMFYALFDYKDSVMTFRFDGNAPEEAVNLSNDESFGLWQVKRIIIDSSMRNYWAEDCSNMFSKYTNVSEIVGLEYINPPLNGDMSYMFYLCRELKSLDLSHLNTNGVLKMNNMFEGCSKLETIDLSNINTTMVTDMSGMFSDCEKLTSLDLSGFDTHNVTNMGWMFKNCKTIDSLNLSTFNTEKVYRMQNMFEGCSRLKYIDLSSFNTEKTQVLCEMFSGCESLKTLDLSTFVRWRAYTNYSNIDKMFSGCTSLKTIYASCNWNMDGFEDYAIFKNCYSLYGGKGFHYSGFDNGDVYARIDKGEEQPGFFTLKGQKPFAPKAYAVLNDSVLTFYYSDNRPDNYYILGGYDNEKGKIKEVVFDKSFKKYYPKSCFHWFGGLYKLETIKGMKEYLNTDSVVTMSEMFYGCRKLKSLDLSGFNTSNVSNMNKMFEDCHSLKTIFVGNEWKTDSVHYSRYMFAGCWELYGSQGTKNKYFDSQNEYQKFAHIDEGKDNPGYLTAIGQEPFTPKEIEIAKEIVPDKKVELVIEAIDSSYWYCDTIRYSDDFEYITEPYLHENTEQDSITAYAVLKDSALYFYYGTNLPATAFVIKREKPRMVYDYYKDTTTICGTQIRTPEWNQYANSIKKVVFDSSFKNFRPNSCNEWFSGCVNLTEIVGMKENLNTEDVEMMSSMFLGCMKLKTIDLSGFNTRKVVNMFGMFSACMSLENLDLSGFKTDNLQQASMMFEGCEKLEKINFGNFNTSKLTSMGSMFFGCKNLKNIDLSSFNTSACAVMSYMFAESGIEHIDLNNFNTENIDKGNFYFSRGLEGMFANCKKLEKLDISNFKTSSYYKGMFFGCSSLKDLKLYHASNGDWSYLFYGCNSLEELDLSCLKTYNPPSMNYMFANCTQLKTIYVSENWNYEYCTELLCQNSDGSIRSSYATMPREANNAFLNCYSLVGGEGTKWNAQNPTDETFAKIDFGVLNSGYFTLKYDNKYHGSKKILIPAKLNGLIYYDDNKEELIDEGKWGFVNEYGEWMIVPHYDNVYNFNDQGIAKVTLNNKTIYIDKDDNEVFVPESKSSGNGYRYSETNSYSDIIVVQSNGKYGYVRNNDTIISPAYDYAWNFNKDGFAKVEINHKIGFIDYKGNIITEPIFDEVKEEYWDDEKMCPVMINNKWGFINQNKHLVIKPQFDEVYRDFHNGSYAQVIINDKIGIIDTTGKFVLEPMIDIIRNDWQCGLNAVKIDDKWGFIDSTMKIAIEPIFEDCSWGFGDNGWAAVKLGGKWGYINTKGEFVVKPKFDYAEKFYSWETTDIKIGDKIGLINKKGKYFLLPYDNDYYVEKRDFEPVKMARITKRNRYNSSFNKVGLISSKGKVLFEPKFSEIKFCKGVILAKEYDEWGINDKNWGIIDKKGNWICEPKYEKIGNEYGWDY